jgi:uncharacterized membrane protein HdeD (DUF308 family)
MLAVRFAPFLLGGIVMASVAVAVFFARFYRETREVLFLYFAAAFAVEAISRTVLAFQVAPNEASPSLYILRAFAYSLILMGIYQKNR